MGPFPIDDSKDVHVLIDKQLVHLQITVCQHKGAVVEGGVEPSLADKIGKLVQIVEALGAFDLVVGAFLLFSNSLKAIRSSSAI